MDAFDLKDLVEQGRASGSAYLEFLRRPSMSLGVYRLPARGADPQRPHTEDEVYHVLGGRATIRVGEQDLAVAAGSVVFVAAGVAHRFHSIEEDLTVLVFFAPAERSLAPGHQERGA